jgi:predicted HAD superfamily Cof-like phosphohydrolase
MTREDIVQEFHEAFDHPINAEWTNDLLTLRSVLIGEECVELLTELHYLSHKAPSEITKEDKIKLLKEATDLQYVLSGMAVALGLKLDEAFVLTHKSNMSKLGEDGKPIRRQDGKILKGPNYAPPNLEDLF